MEERNFALGVAYSKSEVLQVAIFAFVFLGDPLTIPLGIAVACGTAGVLMLSPGGVKPGWATRPALLGLASGAGFAIAAVGYRGAVVTIAPDAAPLMAAAATLVVAQTLQTLLLGGWMFFRSREALFATLAAWRQSILAGAMGALASVGWFTAFALEPVAHVRTLALIEIVFSYAVSRRFFRESVARNELWGLILLALGIVFIVNAG
jgi:drug/metabolite transporter (DMT)-like permease